MMSWRWNGSCRSSVWRSLVRPLAVGAGAAVVLCCVTAVVGISTADALSTDRSSDVSIRVQESYGKLPLAFEANRGQTDGQVQFFSRGSGYSLFLTSTEAVLRLKPRHGITPFSESRTRALSMPTESAVLRMQLLGASRDPLVVGEEQLPGRTHYYTGSDPARWRTDIPAFGKVHYRDVYPGVDLVYYGNQGQIEFDFVVRPGGDPGMIALRFEGAESLELNAEGDLVLHIDGRQIRQHKPLIYQELNGARQNITGGYIFTGKHEVGFRIAAYDASKPLVIDPVLSYSTYLGSNSTEYGLGITVDAAGNAYVTGFTDSINFPGAAPRQQQAGDLSDAFVTKLNPSGSAVLYSTYLGGSGYDQGTSIALDAQGNAYVTGHAESGDFPLLAALQSSFGGGFADAFVVKLDPAGALAYSTYLGGSGTDIGYGIAVDAQGNIALAGSTDSPDFPTASPTQSQIGGGIDAYVAKLNPAGSALIYASYLGGTADEEGYGIGVDASGNAYVAGYTGSDDFPTVAALQPTFGGSYDAFVSKLSPAGLTLYATYLGGSDEDLGTGIAVDASGNAYVTGYTGSGNFPATVGALQSTIGGAIDAFVTKLNPAGSALVYATYLGGVDIDYGAAIALDSAGRAHVTGYVSSSSFPTVKPIQPVFMGVYDVFVAKFDPIGSALLFSTFLGGIDDDEGFAIAVDGRGDIYLTGLTTSYNFPTALPLQSALNGGYDVFVTKITEPVVGNHPPVANAGPDQTVACTASTGTRVLLDGSASFDPDGDSLTYTWTGAFGTVTGPTPVVTLPVGIHSITLTVEDGHGGVSSDSLVVTVVDTTPPTITRLTATPGVLWPPNHKMVSVTVHVAAEDRCSPSVSCNITKVTSNEPIHGLGDGDRAPDWVVTGPLTVDLRAERSGRGRGRVYTITVQCDDPSGNQVAKTVTVRVPHDHKSKGHDHDDGEGGHGGGSDHGKDKDKDKKDKGDKGKD